MRMWMIPANLLCMTHLLGEHGEIHKHLPSFRKGHRVHGRFFPEVQIQLNAVESRHDELARELERRGGNHRSPLVDVPDLKSIYPDYHHINVDPALSRRELLRRCPDCAERIKKEKTMTKSQTESRREAIVNYLEKNDLVLSLRAIRENLKDIKISNTTLRRDAAALVKAGMIERHDGKGGHVFYSAVKKKAAPVAAPVSDLRSKISKTERQNQIVIALVNKGIALTRGQINGTFPKDQRVSDTTLRNDLADLIKAGKVKKVYHPGGQGYRHTWSRPFPGRRSRPAKPAPTSPMYPAPKKKPAAAKSQPEKTAPAPAPKKTTGRQRFTRMDALSATLDLVRSTEPRSDEWIIKKADEIYMRERGGKSNLNESAWRWRFAQQLLEGMGLCETTTDGHHRVLITPKKENG